MVKVEILRVKGYFVSFGYRPHIIPLLILKFTKRLAKRMLRLLSPIAARLSEHGHYLKENN